MMIAVTALTNEVATFYHALPAIRLDEFNAKDRRQSVPCLVVANVQ